MIEEDMIQTYERIRKTYGENFTYDGGDYVMQRVVDGLVINLEPPQEGFGISNNTYVLLTAPLREGTPEELRDVLDAMITKRTALKNKGYKGQLKDYDEGIEYAYEIPTRDGSDLVRIVQDFNNI